MTATAVKAFQCQRCIHLSVGLERCKASQNFLPVQRQLCVLKPRMSRGSEVGKMWFLVKRTDGYAIYSLLQRLRLLRVGLGWTQGLVTVRILYSRISGVFHNEFSSNGRAGLMLLLSFFFYWPRISLYSVTLAGRLSSCQDVGHCISWSRGIIEDCENFLPPDSRLLLSTQGGYTGW